MKTVIFRINFLVAVCTFLFPSPILSQQVSIDTTSARAVLKALHDPHLTREKAMEISKLTGNQGMIKKMFELKEADTDEQFAGALFATAHDQASGSPEEEHYYFAAAKASTPKYMSSRAPHLKPSPPQGACNGCLRSTT